MASQIQVVLGELQKLTARKVQELTLAITANLIEDTPVDTGWAHNNWVPSIGRPHEGLSGSRDAPSTVEQQLGLAQVVSTYRAEQGNVHITNNVPYIEALNGGHSQKAPAGFVELAVEKGKQEVIRT